MNFQKNNIDFTLYIIYVSPNVFIARIIIDRRQTIFTRFVDNHK